MVLEFRTGPEILNYVNGSEIRRYSQTGVVTPDHNIRTKNYPLLLNAPERDGLNSFRESATAALDAYQEDYRSYFERHNPRQKSPKTMLDPFPRVALVPGSRSACSPAQVCVSIWKPTQMWYSTALPRCLPISRRGVSRLPDPKWI